jgi:hypothetical protein
MNLPVIFYGSLNTWVTQTLTRLWSAHLPLHTFVFRLDCTQQLAFVADTELTLLKLLKPVSSHWQWAVLLFGSHLSHHQGRLSVALCEILTECHFMPAAKSSTRKMPCRFVQGTDYTKVRGKKLSGNNLRISLGYHVTVQAYRTRCWNRYQA